MKLQYLGFIPAIISLSFMLGPFIAYILNEEYASFTEIFFVGFICLLIMGFIVLGLFIGFGQIKL